MRAVRRGGQRGAALLAVTALLALGLAGVVLGAGMLTLEEVRAWREERTTRALASAKAALLGYAASYVEQHPPGPGPGYLPCPDVDGDGSPDPACPDRAAGWLPWRRLGLAEPADGAGAHLWYALADPFRANPVKHTPLDRSVATHLRDGLGGELAAVVLAPGAPLGAQVRGRPELSPERYLEGANARPHEGRFERAGRAGEQHNDRVLSVAVGEVMRVVEARVMAELGRTIATFRDAPWNPARQPPWLRPHPDSPQARSEVGARTGFLAVHRAGEAFAAGFELAWEDAGAHRVGAPGGVLSAAPLTGAVGEADGVCVWRAVDVFWCWGRGLGRHGPGPPRALQVVLQIGGAGAVGIAPPGPGRPRTRSLALDGALPPGTGLFVVLGRPAAIYRAAAGDRVQLRIAGVRFALAPPLDVPEWLLANGWHDRMRLRLAGAGSVVAACAEVPGCPVLRRIRPLEAGSGPPGRRAG